MFEDLFLSGSLVIYEWIYIENIKVFLFIIRLFLLFVYGYMWVIDVYIDIEDIMIRNLVFIFE